MKSVGGVARLLALSVALSGVALAQDAPDPANVFDWQFSPPIGLSGRYTTFTRFKSSQNVPASPATKAGAKSAAQRMETEEWATLTTDYEVISRDLKGNTVSRLTYRGFKQNQTRKIDGKLVPLPDTSRLPKLEKLFGGLQIDIKLAPDGRVLNVLGLDTMQRRFKRALDKQSAADAATMKAQFAEFCDETSLRYVWGDADLRPKTPLRGGEGWQYQQPLDFPLMKLSAHGTRRLTALDGTFATISDRGTVSSALEDATLAQDLNAKDKSDAQVGLSDGGTQARTSVINRKNGMEIDTYFTRRMALVAEAKAPQWYSWQSHRVFRANSEIESIE